jgi:hypothetical protein
MMRQLKCPAITRLRARYLATCVAVCLVTCLTGCGLVGTTAATAAGASAEVEQAKQAKQLEDQVRQQLQLDAKQDHARLEQAEKDAQ